MKPLALIFSLLCSAAALADEPKPILTMTEAQALRVREVEYQGQKVLVQMYQLQQQLAQLKQKGQQFEQQLDATVADIAKQNNIDQKKYDFNMDTMAWTPKPEEKKP